MTETSPADGPEQYLVRLASRRPLISTGVAGLDYALRGGLPQGSATVVIGGPGTGKTTLGLQYAVTQAARGEKVLFITTEVFRQQLYETAAGYGWDLVALEDAGTLALAFLPGGSLFGHWGQFESTIGEVNPQHVVVDSLAPLERTVATRRFRETVFQFFMAAKRADATALYLCEERRAEVMTEAEFAADNVVILHADASGDVLFRSLLIKKARGVAHALHRVPFVLGPSGLGTVVPSHSVRVLGAPRKIACSTGIPVLDELTGGGLPQGAVLLVEREPKAPGGFVPLAIAAACLKQGWGVITWVPDVVSSPDLLAGFARFGVDVADHARDGRILLVDVFGHPQPPVVRPYLISVTAETPEELLRQQTEIFRRLDASGRRWARHADLETLAARWPEELAIAQLTRLVSRTRNRGELAVFSVTLGAVPAGLLAVAEDRADAVLRVWTQGPFCLLRFTKNGLADRFEPRLVEFSPDPPYVRVV